MKITDIRVIHSNRYLFVEIETDTGIVGLGEYGAWAFLEAGKECIESFKSVLIGMDPLRIEHITQYLYRAHHFRGSVIVGAISAIDIALWDISGQHFGTPVWQLLGGKCREKARVYRHVWGSTTAESIQGCLQAKRNGFTAVGHLNPFLDISRDVPYQETFSQKINRATERVRLFREALGDDVDLCLELHRRCTVHEAVCFASAIESFRPIFIEDPVRPDNFDDMAQVARKINIPIATGERLHSPQEFAMLLRAGSVNYIRPDVCCCGGISGAKKIAGMAEAFGVQVVPHNPLSPVSTAVCVQLAACIPNFCMLEYPGAEDIPPKSEIVQTDVVLDNGYLVVPDTPGIGARLAKNADKNHPPLRREIKTRLSVDGSVVDT